MESQKGLRQLFFIRGAARLYNPYDPAMMYIARVPIIRTLSLGDLMEMEEDKDDEGREEATEEMNIHPPSLYLPSQLENEKVGVPF